MDTRCMQGLEPCASLLCDPVLCSAHSLQPSFQESKCMGIKPWWVSSRETILPLGSSWAYPFPLGPR